MTKYLLDTNHMGQAVAAHSPLLRRMVEATQNGDRFGTCFPVLCEIEVGRLQVSKPDKYQHLLNKLLKDLVKIWPLTKQTAGNYGQIYGELKAKRVVLCLKST